MREVLYVWKDGKQFCVLPPNGELEVWATAEALHSYLASEGWKRSPSSQGVVCGEYYR